MQSYAGREVAARWLNWRLTLASSASRTQPHERALNQRNSHKRPNSSVYKLVAEYLFARRNIRVYRRDAKYLAFGVY